MSSVEREGGSRPRVGRSRWLAALAAIAALSIAMAACGDDESSDGGSEGGSSGESSKVTFALGFSPNYGQAPFFTALEDGLYEEAGLDVDFVVPDSTQTAAKLVGVGKADAGEFFGLDPVLSAGEGIPIKVAATWAWGALGLMADPTKDEVTAVEDLEGKKVGVFEGLPYSDACRPRLLEAHGLSPDDVETVDVGFNSVTPLLTGKVAASEGGDPAETVTMETEQGEPPTYFPYEEACPPFLFGVFVNAEWAEENPETASKFVEATMEGAKRTTEDPELAHQLFTDRFADLEQPLVQFERFGAAACGPDTASEGIGYNDQAVYEELISLSQEAGFVEGDLAYEDVVTDEYLPDEPVTSSVCE